MNNKITFPNKLAIPSLLLIIAGLIIVMVINGCDLADVNVTQKQESGWQFIKDGEYNQNSRLELVKGDTFLYHINGAVNLNSQLPDNITTFWDTTLNHLVAANLSDVYQLRFDFTAVPKTNDSSIRIVIDIGTKEKPDWIIERTQDFSTFSKRVEKPINIAFPMFVGQSFLDNDCKIYLIPNGGIEIWDMSLFISRTHKGQSIN